MKNCFYIPRILVPGKERTNWSVIACDRYRNERSYWESENAARGADPSALDLILPEFRLGENDDEEFARIREEMYAALENDYLEKLLRGWVLTERKTASYTRRGIVGAIDLECYSYGGGEGQVRSLQAADEELVRAYLKQRENAPVEMPHIMILYDDPKDKAVGALKKEDPEKLYDYKIKNGSLKGYFLSEKIAEETAERILSRTQNFFVIEGVAAAEAAKVFWQKVKAGITKGEMGRHPARFLLAEFINLSDEAVDIQPVHRLVRETEKEAFLDFISKKFKCEKSGSLLVPKIAFSKENILAVDEAVAQFLKADGGRLCYVHGEDRLKKFAEEEGSAGICMPSPKKESLSKEVGEGGSFPANSLCVGGADGARYYVEAREISYD